MFGSEEERLEGCWRGGGGWKATEVGQKEVEAEQEVCLKRTVEEDELKRKGMERYGSGEEGGGRGRRMR